LQFYLLSIFSLLETKKILGGVLLEREELNDVQHEKDTVGLRHGFRLKVNVLKKAVTSLKKDRQNKSERSFKSLKM